MRGFASVVLIAAAVARADIAPRDYHGEARPAPGRCVRKTVERTGPRGTYRLITLPVVTVVVSTDTHDRVDRAVQKALPDLAPCYRAPETESLPLVERSLLTLLFASGILEKPSVRPLSRLDVACVVERVQRANLSVGKITRMIDFDLVFTTECKTVTCPSAGAAVGLGRRNPACD